MAAAYVHPPVVPDPAPAARLRDYLARARDRGQHFDDAWQFAVCFATRGLEGKERTSWADAFAATRGGWSDGYERQGLGDIATLMEAP